jgi:hypothetical protein
MLIVYAVTVGWAGLNNLFFTTTTYWKIFAIFQAWIVYTLVRQFWQFRRAQKYAAKTTTILPGENPTASTPSRTERWFPWFTLLLGGVALLIFIAVLASAFVLRSRSLLPLLNVLEPLAINMAVLGLATGLASGLTITSNKWVSIVGSVASGLTLLVELAIPVLMQALT